MAAVVTFVLTSVFNTLLIFQLSTVLFSNEINEDLSYGPEMQWLTTTLKIRCYGKEILAKCFTMGCTKSSKWKKRDVNTTQYLCFLCLILSNDIQFNP